MGAHAKNLRARTIIAGLGTLLGCNSGGPMMSEDPYEPDLPTVWVASVTNPYFPLLPGMRWSYESETD